MALEYGKWRVKLVRLEVSFLLPGRVIWQASRVVRVMARTLVGQAPLAARTLASCSEVWVAARNTGAEDWLFYKSEVVWKGRAILLVVLDCDWVVVVRRE